MAEVAKDIVEARQLILELQARLTRVVEMSRLIQVEAEHLSPDSEPTRFRVCAEIAQEAAEMASEEVERVDLAFRTIGASISGEVAHA